MRTESKELVIITKATQKVLQMADEFNTSSMKLLEQYQSDLGGMYQATAAKMAAALGEELELFVREESGGDAVL